MIFTIFTIQRREAFENEPTKMQWMYPILTNRSKNDFALQGNEKKNGPNISFLRSMERIGNHASSGGLNLFECALNDI